MALTIQRRSLATIPQEVQDMIWDLVLVTAIPLRPINEPKRSHKPSAPTENIFNVSLLLVCREIYRGAVAYFYSKNQFHYTILEHGLCDLRPNPLNPLRANCLVHMPEMRKISMHFDLDEVYTHRGRWNIADYLRQVVQHCHSLRIFILSMLRSYSEVMSFLSWLHLTVKEITEGQDVPATIALSELSQLPKLQRLTIITPNLGGGYPHNALTALASAPHANWVLIPEELRRDEFDGFGWGMPGRAVEALILRARSFWPSKKIEAAGLELATWTYRPEEERALQGAANKEVAARETAAHAAAGAELSRECV